MGFRNVGKVDAMRGGIDQSAHSMSALLSVCHTADQAQDKAFDKDLLRALSSGGTCGVCIQRYHDATPILLRFGRLQEQVYQAARYLVRDPSRRTGWKSVTYSEMLARAGKSWVPNTGTLEVFAQSVHVSLWDRDGSCKDINLKNQTCLLGVRQREHNVGSI